MDQPAHEWLCPCDCWARAEAARGCGGKPIKKCHWAPLSLSQMLQLESPPTKKKATSSEHCLAPMNAFFLPNTHPGSIRPSQTTLPRETVSALRLSSLSSSRRMKVLGWGSQLTAGTLWNDLVYPASATLCPHAAAVYRIIPSAPNDCVNRWMLYFLCDMLCLPLFQCHSPGLPGWAAQELCGHAGADAGREGLLGDWIPAREGVAEPPLHIENISEPQWHITLQ